MCKSWNVLKGPICKNSYFSFPTRQIPTQRDAGWPVQSFHPKQQYLKVQFVKKVDLWVSFPSSNYNIGILCFFLLIWNYEQNQARSFSLLFSLILSKTHFLCSWKIQMKFKKCFSKPSIRKISYILSCLCHKGRNQVSAQCCEKWDSLCIRSDRNTVDVMCVWHYLFVSHSGSQLKSVKARVPSAWWSQQECNMLHHSLSGVSLHSTCKFVINY